MRPPSEDPLLRTTHYYNAHAERYTEDTRGVNLAELYQPFLSCVPPGGHILDAGCGSGRDARAFRNLGYRVSAFDASPRMVELSSEVLGQPVQLGTFQTLECREEFDGIWACASLLHVPRAEMGEVLARLWRALRPGGVLYASVKRGAGEGWEGERFFSRYTEDQIRSTIVEAGGLECGRVWLTRDVRPGRDAEKWINLLARRVT